MFKFILKYNFQFYKRKKVVWNNVPIRAAGLAEFTSRGVVRFVLVPCGALLPPEPMGSPPRIASASYGSVLE